jgi:hypothetical protein
LTNFAFGILNHCRSHCSYHLDGPYVFFTSKRPGVTAASPVLRSNEMIGVNIEISGLSNFLNDVPLSEHDRAFIVDRHGTAVAFPKPDWVGHEFGDGLPKADMVGGAVVQSWPEYEHPCVINRSARASRRIRSVRPLV